MKYIKLGGKEIGTNDICLVVETVNERAVVLGLSHADLPYFRGVEPPVDFSVHTDFDENIYIRSNKGGYSKSNGMGGREAIGVFAIPDVHRPEELEDVVQQQLSRLIEEALQKRDALKG